MDIILFFGLAINLFAQLLRKGQKHIDFYKEINLIDGNESFAKTFLLGAFFKYPMVVIPFVENFEDLNENEKRSYKKLKLQTNILWFSILLFVGFFFYVFMFYEK